MKSYQELRKAISPIANESNFLHVRVPKRKEKKTQERSTVEGERF